MTEGAGPTDRRQFFAESLGRLLGPVAEFLERRMPPPTPRTHVRPPGAIGEDSFLDTCQHCGTCIEVCPARAIVALRAPGHAADGTPIIDPDLGGCLMCEGLPCTNRCPSGALRVVSDRRAIRMGVAVVQRYLCLRRMGDGCTRCVDVCPLGSDAISITGDDPPKVRDPGCTGCGLCQFHCPTRPKAILVKPA